MQNSKKDIIINLNPLLYTATAALALLGASAGLNNLALYAGFDDVTTTKENGDTTTTHYYGTPKKNGNILMTVTRPTEAATTDVYPRYTQGHTKTTYVLGLPVYKDYTVLRDVTMADMSALNHVYPGNNEYMGLNPALLEQAEYMQTLGDIEGGFNPVSMLASTEERLEKTNSELRKYKIGKLRAEFEKQRRLSMADPSLLLGIPEDQIDYETVVRTKQVADGSRRVRDGESCSMQFSAVGYNGRPGMRRKCEPRYKTETTYKNVTTEEKILPAALQDQLRDAQAVYITRANKIYDRINAYENLAYARKQQLRDHKIYTKQVEFMDKNGPGLEVAWQQGQRQFAAALDKMAAGWKAQARKP